MIWFAWRQQRLQILLSLAVIAAVAAVIVWVRFDTVTQWAQLGMPGCWQRSDGCSGPGNLSVYDHVSAYLTLRKSVGLALPALLGMFVGAPMFAREAERGTHVFALTQSVSRTRWWVTKALVGGLPVVVAMTGLGLLNTWASAPLENFLNNRLTTPRFETEGLALGGYTLLAVALGIALGLWVRSTVPGGHPAPRMFPRGPRRRPRP